jgi:hypothetical protein
MNCVRVPAMEPGTEWAFVGHREQDSSVVMYFLLNGECSPDGSTRHGATGWSIVACPG